MKTVILFSGQGAQYLGMAKRHMLQPNKKVEQMYQLASDVFKRDLLSLCMHGPKEELDRTVNCQVAMFVTSLANLELAREKDPSIVKNCVATAGYSVGEFAALVLAGALTFENALNLLRLRSKLMQDACNATPSGLMTVFLTHKSELKAMLKAGEEWCTKKMRLDVPVVCAISNYISPDVKVIGANEEALSFISLNYKQFNIQRIKRIPVSGAFHTKLMNLYDGTANPLHDLLSKTEVNHPKIDVYSNVTGVPYKNTRDIILNLSRQYYWPCKWEQIMQEYYGKQSFDVGADLIETYETGPGAQLGTFLRLTNIKAYKYYKTLDPHEK